MRIKPKRESRTAKALLHYHRAMVCHYSDGSREQKRHSRAIARIKRTQAFREEIGPSVDVAGNMLLNSYA